MSDCLDIPAPFNRFVHPSRARSNSSQDFAISIAVIHHLSSDARRIQGVKAILNLLKPTGKALIYVWALEQKSSRRGWDETSEQDVMVPWKTREGAQEVTSQRYYHLFRKGELEDCVEKARGKVMDSGYERVTLNTWRRANRLGQLVGNYDASVIWMS